MVTPKINVRLFCVLCSKEIPFKRKRTARFCDDSCRKIMWDIMHGRKRAEETPFGVVDDG